MTRQFIPLAVILSSLLVSACASNDAKDPTTKTTSATQNSARPTLETESIDRAMQTALANAEASGDQQQVIATLAQIQSRNPDDAILATRYARALREGDQLNKAQKVLQPFVKAEEPNAEAVTEMAMTQLGLGKYKEAKKYALKSTVIDPDNARGYLALGTAQDALKDHPNAEQSFRQGLKHWKGDPSPILNNLALNLASQGHLEESLSLLERALKISPERMELERNRRIIATLLETASPTAPSPVKKPKIIIPETAKPAAKKTNSDDEKKTEEKETADKPTLSITSDAAKNIEAETKKAMEPKIIEPAADKKIKKKTKSNFKVRPK